MTLLQDATAGLHTLFLGEMPQTNCSLPIADPNTRTGLFALRAQLASETGTPFTLGSEITEADVRWNQSLEVITAWNNPAASPSHTAVLGVLSGSTSSAIMELLADLLFELDQRQRGIGYNMAFSSLFRPAFAEAVHSYLAQPRGEQQLDDLYLTAIIGHEILSLFLPS